jgi:hypothetical protein
MPTQVPTGVTSGMEGVRRGIPDPDEPSVRGEGEPSTHN